MKTPRDPYETGYTGSATNVFPDHIALGQTGSSKFSTVALILATPFVIIAVFGVWMKSSVESLLNK